MELKTAVLVIGVFNLVAALFGVLGSGLGAAGTGVGIAAVNGAFGEVGDWNATLASGELDQEAREQLKKLANSLGQGSNGDTLNKEDVNNVLGFAVVMMVVLLVICILYVIVASLLIHGARKGKPGLLVPWMVLTVITLIYAMVQLIRTVVVYIDNPTVLGLNCGLIGCFIGLASYLMAIVFSFRQQLREGDASGPKA